MPSKRIAESVWDYPRPPRLQADERRIRIRAGGKLVVDSTRCFRILETSHPPTWYIPRSDLILVGPEDKLLPHDGGSFCEFKGRAEYWSLKVGDLLIKNCAWSYPSPPPAYAMIRDYLSFYPSRVDECMVDEERVTAQEGDFYGGWTTSDVKGPFKGAPGTRHW